MQYFVRRCAVHSLDCAGVNFNDGFGACDVARLHTSGLLGAGSRRRCRAVAIRGCAAAAPLRGARKGAGRAAGGGDVMRGNLLANCVRESGDHGPFNSWDRVPYITTASGKPSIIPVVRQIEKNLIIST